MLEILEAIRPDREGFGPREGSEIVAEATQIRHRPSPGY
jgi:hypothetical protein